MKKEEISSEQYARILESFMNSLVKNGLKGTTMDSVASSLQMSKRTLYEIFGTKDEMFREAHIYFHKKLADKLGNIFASSSNVMEAIVKCFLYNRDLMSNLSTEFIRDMQIFAQHSDMEMFLEKNKCQANQYLYDVLQKGVTEGYFREDMNLWVQCRMLKLQMEALKHTEDLFPKDISLIEAYDTIIVGFLRGISTQKGLDELERYLPSL